MQILLQTGPHELPDGYGVSLLQSLLSLVAVCVLAWVVLRMFARRGIGVGGSGGRIRVVERIPLDVRRTLYVVKVGERLLLLGAGDAASPSLITEIDPKELPPLPPPRPLTDSFRDVLARVRGKQPEQGEKEDGD